MIGARVVLIVVAIGALLALGWWTRASVLEQQAQRVSDNPFRVTDRAQANQALERLERAAELNPDRRPELVEGVLLLRAERPRRAVASFSELVRAEPENVEAWAFLAVAAADVAPGRARRARARVAELNPLAVP